MAKEPAKKESAAGKSEASATPTPAAKGGGMFKVLALLIGVLVLEGATVGVTMIMAGGPKQAEGQTLKTDAKAEEDKLAELLVVKDQFPNQRTGRTYLYDTEIYITVHCRDAEKVKKQVEAMQATLATDIAVIFRRADTAYLLEPTLATLTRQIKAALDERIGKDVEGRSIVQEALIRKCIQLRLDN